MDIYNPKYLSMPEQVQKNKEDIEELKTKTSIHAYLIQAAYSATQSVYQKGQVVIESGELQVGDLIFFNNSYYAIVESIGLTTFTVLAAISFKGEKGNPGEAGFVEITSLNLNESNTKVVYDSITGATLTGQGQVTYDNGTVSDINVEYKVPINAGTGISINANETNNMITVKVECDSTPTEASVNPITSGSVYKALSDINTELAKCGVDSISLPTFAAGNLGYIRYNNGIQFVFGSFGTFKGELSAGTIVEDTMTFPVTFSERPLFAIAMSWGNLNNYDPLVSIPSTSTVTATLQRKTISKTYLTTCYVLFIGKWK